MSRKRDVTYRAYQARSDMNAGKRLRLEELACRWRRGLAYAMSWWTRTLLETGRMPRYADTKSWPDWLTQRQWDSVNRQSHAALESWCALREIDFRRIVRDSGVDPGMRRTLLSINARRAWWERKDDEAHRLARHVIKHLRDRIPFPDMSRCRTMSMDGKVARIEDAAHATGFRRWATVSTLDKGNPIRIPITVDPRLEEGIARDETLANHLQLRIGRDGDMSMHLMTTTPKTRSRDEGNVIGLDWGLDCLFATSDGRLYGRTLFAWLKRRDDELTALTRELGRSHIPYRRSRRYRNLTRRIREHVKNEVGRVLNIIADSTVRELVVEDLDFRHGGLSRRMNRIVNRAGRGAVRTKLDQIRDRRGVTVTKVNPAYTSQECSNCHYPDKRNRPKRDLFHCKSCGRTLHADINASRNILARRSREDGWRGIGRKEILGLLQQEHAQRTNAAKSAATPRSAPTDATGSQGLQ